jgi:hypothetical protein
MNKCVPGDKVFVAGVARLGENAFLRDPGSDIIHTGQALELACLLHCKKGRNRKAEEELKDVTGVLPPEKPRKNTRARRKPRKRVPNEEA